MKAEPVVAVRGLRFRYDGGQEALSGVDFDLHTAETVAVLGANGSGKTTFLLHLNGILRGEGDVRVCGMPVVAANLTAIRKKIGYLFQDPEEQLFLPNVLEDVAFGPLQTGVSHEVARQMARTALAQVGVEHGHDRAPWALSAGEKQRVALAGLLAIEPEILVLDEPTNHLDPPARRQLAELLRSLPQAKIVVTHDVSFALKLASRAVFFDSGRIVDEGTVHEVSGRQGWHD